MKSNIFCTVLSDRNGFLFFFFVPVYIEVDIKSLLKVGVNIKADRPNERSWPSLIDLLFTPFAMRAEASDKRFIFVEAKNKIILRCVAFNHLIPHKHLQS